LADEIRSEFDVEAQLIPGEKGIFDVNVDGNVIFSKRNMDNRFPHEGEITDLIRALN